MRPSTSEELQFAANLKERLTRANQLWTLSMRALSTDQKDELLRAVDWVMTQCEGKASQGYTEAEIPLRDLYLEQNGLAIEHFREDHLLGSLIRSCLLAGETLIRSVDLVPVPGGRVLLSRGPGKQLHITW